MGSFAIVSDIPDEKEGICGFCQSLRLPGLESLLEGLDLMQGFRRWNGREFNAPLTRYLPSASRSAVMNGSPLSRIVFRAVSMS